MIYVFDNSPLSTLFRNYYPGRFPSLWQRFDVLVVNRDIVSTREVLREIEDGAVESLREWARETVSCSQNRTPKKERLSLEYLPFGTFSRTSSAKRF